ncbi:hypothetical protein QA641_36885 [Bradyrhizobium sp. CB1650]|nr:hypothetical protein [Bradyrhizobium sp. CB1650]WGD51074.1 hypothetical protein QA641_36885 [Bradyrhizobium sp. CB1650]
MVVVAERDGYVANPKGLPIKPLKQHQLLTGSILGFPDATSLAGDMTGIELACDVLIPAAMESAIDSENASRIKAHPCHFRS